MLPGFLRGQNPVLLVLLVAAALTAVIVVLVGELTKKGIVAFLGVLSSSGATMDLAMGVSVARHEIVEENPLLTTREIVTSGLRVRRMVIGTMTTTLLLAYSGGYTAMMMVFMAQRTPAIHILNIQHVAAECSIPWWKDDSGKRPKILLLRLAQAFVCPSIR